MPTWGEILEQLTQTVKEPNGVPDWDGVRRGYLGQLHALTGRDTIIYYSDWLGGAGPAITLADMQGLMEVCRGLKGPELDLILHSPGGSAEATASIVRYLRKQFKEIRVFVPLAAMSAATMWALAADRIVMGNHSQLGPIDPQIVLQTGATTPARAIVEQFERATRECSDDPSKLGAWAPILQQYGPALIEQCISAEKLARRLVRQWLKSYMFKSDKDAGRKADRIVKYFASFRTHRSHALGIDREQALARGVLIDPLEADQALQDAILSVHHATLHTFAGPAVKIVENQLGRAWVQLQQMVQIPAPVPPPLPQQTPSA